MSVELTIRNRQRTRPVEVRLLRRIAGELLGGLLELPEAELGITLVGAAAMARINWQFLQHEGVTDVITFDHTEDQISRRESPITRPKISGELFICVDEAVAQARRFRTSWQAELVRYLVHGVLHLCGHDDQQGVARRKMKREENRMVRLLEARFAFRNIGKSAPAK
jgi:probable rRNA maturation factor